MLANRKRTPPARGVGLRLAPLLLLALCPALTGQAAAEEAGGLRFDPPADWQPQPKPMRTANFVVPGAGGDGECAVHYFGAGQGGSVEANVQRWLGQFLGADGRPLQAADAKRAERTVNGIAVTTLDVAGTYLFKPFPMARQAVEKPGYRMLAAIARGPDAPIFFKLTAPAKTAAAAEAAFHRMLDSLRK